MLLIKFIKKCKIYQLEKIELYVTYIYIIIILYNFYDKLFFNLREISWSFEECSGFFT
jgi:hypothetical protein